MVEGRASSKRGLRSGRLAAVLMLVASLVTGLPSGQRAEAADASVTFAVFGDYGDNDNQVQAVAKLVDSKHVDFIATTGDNSYTVTPIDVNIGQYYANYIGDYTGAYGSGSADGNRFFPAMGNHDYTDGGGSTTYLSYFNLPGTLPAGMTSSNTSSSERYYDVQAGPVQLFFIDSNPTPTVAGAVGDGRSPASPQGQWLETQLRASTAEWKLVIFHHSPYSSGATHGTSEDDNYPGSMKWPFEDWGATAVFSSHDHVYERILKAGTDMPYFITGLGGRNLGPFGTSEPGSQVRYNESFGSMIVTASASSITFEFWSIEGPGVGGKLIDTYSIPPAPENWTAYNDTGFATGQTDSNITTFTSPVGGSGLPPSGELVDYASGSGTEAILTVSGGKYQLPLNGAQGDSAMVGDALAVFGGIVNPLGTLSYADNDLVFSFSGLDPTKVYSVVHYANRGKTPPYGWNRAGLATISGALSFVNSSTAGNDNNGNPVFSGPSDDSTRYSADNSTGTDPADGWVVRFDQIRPGTDGAFELTMSWAGEAGEEGKGKYSNAIMLGEQNRPPNVKPVAMNDGPIFVALDTAKVVDVLANDSDPDGVLVPASVTVTDGPSHGSVTGIDPATGAVTYMPDSGYGGSDSFKYRVSDDDGVLSNKATVSLNVVPNLAPVAVNDGDPVPIVVAHDTAKVVDVLANDSDSDGTLAPASVTVTNNPSHGSVTGIDLATGAVTYLPDSGYDGPDSFKYTVKDDDGVSSNVATVTITVLSPSGEQVGLVDISTGMWYLRNSVGAITDFAFGNPGDLAVPGDWDGDEVTTPGLYRRSDGFFYSRDTNTTGIADNSCFAGDPNDYPVVGDWDGDGDETLGLYRPSEQKFYLFDATCTGSPMGAASTSFVFGNEGDIPFAADFDNDGITEVALFRPNDGFVYYRETLTTGIADVFFFWGDPADATFGGNWDALGGDSVGLFRPAEAKIFLRNSNTQGIADVSFPFGEGDWSPIAGYWGLG